MESTEISPDAVPSDSVISFTIDLINAGQTLAAWVAPRVLAIEEYVRGAIDSHLEANWMGPAALASKEDIQMPILKDHPNLSDFDNVVGRLMVLAHLQWGPRIPNSEYQRIAALVDQRGWKPLRQLEGYTRKELGAWNQQSRRPVHSFKLAVAPKSRFRRATLRRFYRAHDKYRKMNRQLSA